MAEDQPAAPTTDSAALAASLVPESAWEVLTDQTQTFTISLPRGWRNQLAVVPSPSHKHTLANSVSPDGGIIFRAGDSDVPMFIQPAAVSGFGPPPGLVIRPGTPAGQMLPEWANFRFGRDEGFRISGLADCQPLVADLVARSQRGGYPLSFATAARINLEFVDSGRTLRSIFLMTTAGVGAVWSAQVYGVTTAGDPEPLVPALLKMVVSSALTAQEQQRQVQGRAASAAQHQATMAQIDANTAAMTANHQQNMANIAASGQAHQQNMANLQAGFDAQNQAWSAQQSGADASHDAFMSGLRSGAAEPGLGGDGQQDFINTIREERTVLDSAGNSYQVEAGHDRYYYRSHDQSWIGLQNHENLADVPGINPDDYEEVRIQS